MVTGLQPDAPPLLTVSEYVLVTVGVAVGFWSVVDDRFAPLQLYIVVPPDGTAVRFTVPPIHIGPLLLTAAVGIGLTVTVVVPLAVQPDPAVLTVTVYTPAIAAVIPLRVGVALVEVYAEGPLHA